VKPFSNCKAAMAHQAAVAQPMKLNYKWNITVQDVDKESLKATKAQREASIQQELKKIAELKVDTAASLQTITAQLLAANLQFIDTDFPPIDSSVAPLFAGRPYGDAITWKRAPEFMRRHSDTGDEKDEPDVKLYEDGISPLDIQQGGLGNCWFCCALSTLAEHPEMIERIFISKDVNPTGIYRLRICKSGSWYQVTLDDFFPCSADAGPIFSCNHGNELWVLLIEKAYAKLHGSYHALKAGRASDALEDLTGFPTDFISFHDEKIRQQLESGAFWGSLCEVAAQQQLLAAGTMGEDQYTESGIDPESSAGLVPGHAYSVLEVKEGGGHKLLKLRNPWGRFEWTGAWSDASELWTEEMKSIFKPSFDKFDGIFWMSFDDFLRYFDSINVCHQFAPSQAAWRETRVTSCFEREEQKSPAMLPSLARASSHYQFTSSAPSCHAFLSIHQRDKRVPGAAPYIDFGALICASDGEVVADTGFAIESKAHVHCELKAGKYTLIPYTTGCKMVQHQAQRHAFTVCLLFEEEESVALESIPYNAQREKKAILQLTCGRGKKTQASPALCVFSWWNGPVLTYAVQVLAQKSAEITMDCGKSKNALSSSGALKAVTAVPADTTAVLHRLVPDNETQNYTFSYGLGWKVSST
jgi:calpain-15